MKQAYIEKRFGRDRLQLIDKVNEVVADYTAQGYSLTLRQVYYQMVARDIIPNNQRSYKNLGSLINDARLAGLIDWQAIEDRTRNLQSNSRWASPGSIINSAAYSYQRDHWAGQDNYVEVWVEKEALVGIVGQICEELDVSYFACKGYVSQSEMWAAAQRLHRRKNQGQGIVLLHLGDHDPSGQDMSRDVVERLGLFGLYGVDFCRLALNMDQIEQYDPPPNPTKLTDSRAAGYISEYGHECWELDALEPRVISDIIKANVEKYRDDETYQMIIAEEQDEKTILTELASGWPAIAKNWERIKGEYI